MEQENQLQIFNNEEFGQVKVIKDEKGEPLFELYSVGTALGYARWTESKGKPYFKIEKSRIDKVMENGSITGLALEGQTFLTEDMLYDFIFESKTEQYIVETHGLQHYEENANFKMNLKEVQKNDKFKKELALNNGIKEENYIVIDCRKSELDWIKTNILKSNLINVFDLYNIDWAKAVEYAYNNLVKIACEYKRDNPDLTTGDIGNLMSIQGQIIRKWLKQSSEIWDWCNYNPKEEQRKNGNKNGNKTNPIICLEKQIIFRSASECSRRAEIIFGVHMNFSSICSVCRGDIEKYKGYKFKLVSNLTEEEYMKYDISNKLKELNQAI